MHCGICNKPVSKANWAKHINTKSHRVRVQVVANYSTNPNVLISPPGPMTNFSKARHQKRRERREASSLHSNNFSQLPFHFYQTKLNINNDRSLILDIKNKEKVKLLNLIEKHVEKDKNIDDIRKDIDRELKEYFNRIKNWIELRMILKFLGLIIAKI